MMPQPSRRRFLKAAAVGAAIPLVAVPAIEAAEPPASADAALLAIVRLRFKHLTEEQLKAVRATLQRGIAAAEVLKQTRLDPTDEPATVFVPDVVE